MLGQKGGAASHRTQPQRAERQDSSGGGCTGPPDFISRQSQAHGLERADMLLAQTAAETVIADKGYDAQARVLEALSLPHAATRRQLGTTTRIFTKPPPSDRKLLCQAQAVSGHRHAVRQDGSQLPGRHPSGSDWRMARLMTRPRPNRHSSGIFGGCPRPSIRGPAATN